MHGTREPYYVAEFSLETLGALIKECFGEAFPDIRTKNQVRYLFDYLHDLEAQSIVCETDYIDRGYLEDYSTYYVSCFGRYQNSCARLHFFNRKFSHEDLSDCLSTAPKKSEVFEIQESYLGFTVIKPIPKTFVGRTCLTPYPHLLKSSMGSIITRKCKANLFGLDLAIDSVAFQEQDKVISACVTSALWSLFHGLPHLNRLRLTSPSEITLAAVSDGRAEINSFPTKGLNNAEIVRALDKFKLKHHAVYADGMSPQFFSQLCTTMINSHHPVLLGGAIFSYDEKENYTYKGEHAVTALGYNVENNDEFRLYVHDDRWGPYVRATLKEQSIQSIVNLREVLKDLGKDNRPMRHSLNKIPEFYLTLGRGNREEQKAPIREIFVPNVLIIGCDKKVRISPDLIIEACDHISQAFKGYFQTNEASITWTITLELSNNLKSEVIGNSSIVNRRDALLTHMPRFVWVAKAHLNEAPQLSLVIDATDIQNGRPLVFVLAHLREQDNVMLEFLRSKDIKDYLEDLDANKGSFLKQLQRSFSVDLPEGTEYLNKTFGPPRAPKYIKPTEVSSNDEILSNGETLEKHFDYDSQPQSGTLDVLKTGAILGIWLIAESGALILAIEESGRGHPTLTGASCARIAGEIGWCNNDQKFLINSQSGRYSGSYQTDDCEKYLRNALKKYRTIFTQHSFGIGSAEFFEQIKKSIKP